jgi:hypothetical protein
MKGAKPRLYRRKREETSNETYLRASKHSQPALSSHHYSKGKRHVLVPIAPSFDFTLGHVCRHFPTRAAFVMT